MKLKQVMRPKPCKLYENDIDDDDDDDYYGCGNHNSFVFDI
jgi:hypothetical protein